MKFRPLVVALLLNLAPSEGKIVLERESLRRFILDEIHSVAAELISDRIQQKLDKPQDLSYGEHDYLHYTLSRPKRSIINGEQSPSDSLEILDEIMEMNRHDRSKRNLLASKQHSFHLQKLLQDAFGAGKQRFSDAELEQILGLYFDGSDHQRLRRSITDDVLEDPLLAENVEIAFPNSDRVDKGKPSVNLIRSDGQIVNDPDAVILTQEDIREITRKSSLAQILHWLEELSQGKEHNVTVLAPKDEIEPQEAAKPPLEDEGKDLTIESESIPTHALRSTEGRKQFEDTPVNSPSRGSANETTKGSPHPQVVESVRKHRKHTHHHKHKHGKHHTRKHHREQKKKEELHQTEQLSNNVTRA